MSPGRGGAKTLTFWNGVAGSPSCVVTLALLGCQPLVGVVEEQQVLALDGEHQHFGVVRLAREHA